MEDEEEAAEVFNNVSSEKIRKLKGENKKTKGWISQKLYRRTTNQTDKEKFKYFFSLSSSILGYYGSDVKPRPWAMTSLCMQ